MTAEEEFNELLKDNELRCFETGSGNITTFLVGLKSWSNNDIKERGYVFNFMTDGITRFNQTEKRYEHMINVLTNHELPTNIIFKTKQIFKNKQS